MNKQIVKAGGFLRGRLLVDRKLTFWTTTSWKDASAMRAFRDTGAHKRVMPKLASWCSEATSVHWEQEDDRLPDWKQAYQRLISEGSVIYVKAPSGDQQERKFAEPRQTKAQQELRPQ